MTCFLPQPCIQGLPNKRRFLRRNSGKPSILRHTFLERHTPLFGTGPHGGVHDAWKMQSAARLHRSRAIDFDRRPELRAYRMEPGWLFPVLESHTVRDRQSAGAVDVSIFIESNRVYTAIVFVKSLLLFWEEWQATSVSPIRSETVMYCFEKCRRAVGMYRFFIGSS